MHLNHYHRRSIKAGRNSQVFWATKPTGRIIIFVHGFHGKSTGTWEEIPGLLSRAQEMNGTDIIYYGYNSTRVRAHASAIKFGDFVDKLKDDSTQYMDPLIREQRKSTGTHDNSLVIVAHSLGALVARQALLIGHKKTKEWIKSTKLILFAPADLGTNLAPVQIGRTLLTDLLFTMELFIELCGPVMADVREGSQFINDLRRESQRLVDQGVTSLLATAIFHAERELIVNQGIFLRQEPAGDVFNRATHRSICKPGSSYQEPLKKLLAAI